jgi:hypothetical protein
MQKVKMQMKDGTVQEFEACQILKEINDCEDLTILIAMEWGSTGKSDFLTGKTGSTVATIAEPLTKQEAEQAIKEYNELMDE